MNVRLSQMDNVIWGTLIVGGGAVNQTKHLNINIVKINSRTDLTYETQHIQEEHRQFVPNCGKEGNKWNLSVWG